MSPIAIVLFLAATEAGAPSTEAMIAAASEVVGARGRVEVRFWNGPSGPDDESLVEAARVAGAACVARVVWAHANHETAVVFARRVVSSETIQLPVVFQATDELAQRGRALGLIMGSFALSEPTPSRPPSVSAIVSPPPAAVPPDAKPSPWALEAYALGGWALAEAGDGWGGGLGLRRMARPNWHLRVGARARTASVSRAQASFLTAAFLGGVAYAFRGGTGSTLGVAIRADLMLLYDSLTHFSSDDPEPVTRGRLLPGSAAAVEGDWFLSPAVSVFVAGGPELAFGRTAVLVRGQTVGDIPPLRLLIEAGLRAHF